jgi:hypothetical protein
MTVLRLIGVALLVLGIGASVVSAGWYVRSAARTSSRFLAATLAWSAAICVAAGVIILYATAH